jgi:hypothetical protein
MRFNELKVGQKVSDSWFPSWGTGKVTILLKTRVMIKFRNANITYDKGHVQFLSREDK